MAIMVNNDNKLHVLPWLCRFILLLHHLLVCFSEVMFNVVILQHLLLASSTKLLTVFWKGFASFCYKNMYFINIVVFSYMCFSNLLVVLCESKMHQSFAAKSPKIGFQECRSKVLQNLPRGAFCNTFDLH